MKNLMLIVILLLGSGVYAQNKPVYYTYIPKYTVPLKGTVVGKHTKYKWGKKFYFIQLKGDTILQTYDIAMYDRITPKDTVFNGVRRFIWRD